MRGDTAAQRRPASLTGPRIGRRHGRVPFSPTGGDVARRISCRGWTQGEVSHFGQVGHSHRLIFP